MPSRLSSGAAPAVPQVKSHLDTFAVTTMLACTWLWALGQVAVKVGNSGFSPVFQATLRSSLACVLVFLWCMLRRIPLFERDGTLVAGIVAGLLFAFEFVVLFIGMDYTTVSRSVVLLYLCPIIVAVGAHFLLGERLTPLKLVGLFAAFAGVVLAFADHLALPDQSSLLGDILCVVAAFGWATTTLTIRTTSLARASAEKVLVYQLAVSAVVLFPTALLLGPLVREITPIIVVSLLYQVTIVVALSYVVWFWLLNRYPASQLSTFSFLTPLIAVFLSWLLLDEPISLRLLGALALVALGIYLVGRKPALVPLDPRGEP